MPSSSSETIQDICGHLGYSVARQGSDCTRLNRLTSKFMRTHGHELPTPVPDSNEAKELAFKFCYEKYCTAKNGDTINHGEHLWPASSDKRWYRDEAEILVLVARLICAQERRKSSNKKQKSKRHEEELRSLTLRDDSPMPLEDEPQATVEAENSSNTLPVVNNSVHSDLDEAINAAIELDEEQDETNRGRSNFQEVESSESFRRHQQRQRRTSEMSWSPGPSQSTHNGQKRKRQQNADHLLKNFSTKVMRMPGASHPDPQVGNSSHGLALKRRTRQTTITESEMHANSLEGSRLSPPEGSPLPSMFVDHVDIPSKDTNTEIGLRTPPTTATRMAPPRPNPDVGDEDEHEGTVIEYPQRQVSATSSLLHNEPLRSPPTPRAARRTSLTTLPLLSFAVPTSLIELCILKYHSGLPGLSQPIPMHKLAANGLDFQNCSLSEFFKWYNSFSGMPEALESLKCLIFVFYEGSLRRHWEIEASDPNSSLEALKTRIRESVGKRTQSGHSASFTVEVTPPGWDVIGFDHETSPNPGVDRSPVTQFPN